MQCLLKLCSPLIEIIGIRLISLTLMFTLPAPSIFFCKSVQLVRISPLTILSACRVNVPYFRYNLLRRGRRVKRAGVAIISLIIHYKPYGIF